MVEQKINDEYMMPSELSKEDVTHISFKLRSKLKNDYFNLCESKKITVSKRLRNFMIYELKKEETSRINSEASRVKQVEVVEETKPKDLNTDVSNN